MSFHISQVIETADGIQLVGDRRKVRLSGPVGPIARHVLSLVDESGQWCLMGESLARELAPEEWADSTVWLLWDSGEFPSQPLVVRSIPGVSSEFATELMVQMELMEACGDSFRPLGKQTGEALRLLGGRITPNASWAWAEPKMAIGSTIVAPIASVKS